MDLLLLLATYIAAKTSKTLGKDVFYNEMPELPNECICVYEKPNPNGVPPQINALMHKITIGIRSSSNVCSFALSNECFRWMLSDDVSYVANDENSEATGYVKLSETVAVYIWLHGPPVWDKADQQGRKYYSFNATITTSR